MVAPDNIDVSIVISPSTERMLATQAPASSPGSPTTPTDDDLPGYSPRIPVLRRSSAAVMPRPKTEHVYHLMNRNDRPWLTLTVLSYASSAKSLPIFAKEDTISGWVELTLEREDHIQGVILKLEGQIMPLQEANYVFLTQQKTLWNTSMGDPRNPSHTSSFSSSPKLKGSYKWTFELKLPTKLQTQNDSSTLPPSFNGLSQILYRLDAVIERGKFRVDSRVSTTLGYCPRTRAPQPSYLRQMAYEEHGPLLGPEIDLDGWEYLNPAVIYGDLFNARPVEISWKLAIAKPLEYARGSIIPLSLELESSDTDALALLCKPTCPVVGLVKSEWWNVVDSAHLKLERVKTRDSYHDGLYTKENTGDAPSGSLHEKQHSCVATAVWWPSTENSGDRIENRKEGDAAGGRQKRYLSGEIHLPRNLTSSFAFWKVAISYSIHLVPPRVAGFTPRSPAAASASVSSSVSRQRSSSQQSKQPPFEPLLIHDVTIVTDRAIGPIPQSYTPPGYDAAGSSNSVKELVDAALSSGGKNIRKAHDARRMDAM